MQGNQVFAERRKRFAGLIGSGIAVLCTAPEQIRNRDVHYPYRFNSYFYYLTGFPEPDAIVVVVGGNPGKSLLFCREKDPEREIWDGFRYGPKAAQEILAVDEAHPVSKIDEIMPQLLANQRTVFCEVGADSEWDARLINWINLVRTQARSGVCAPTEIRDARSILDDMRLTKDASETQTMRRAARIAAQAHIRAMKTTRPGLREYEIEAELIHEFRRNGAQAPAYSPIVAAGPNACILHYVQNDATLQDGDLLLIDAGCEVDGYASDITRTFPVSGKFTGPQRDVYELVLAAQAAAIEKVRPGNEWEDPHVAAVRVLAQGMVDLGLCHGSADAVIESGDYRRFYMHRTGHWLGMDVHDVGDYKRDGAWRKLAPGMTLTVEPGCYIRPGEKIPEALWNIGVRIEDDALVTAGGCEIITAAAPKTIAEIESIMRG